jgi:cellulose biosynthesis protein BcsQ
MPLQFTAMSADTGKKALVIDLDATYWGTLYINLPRSLLDASEGGRDTKYTVLVNGQDAGNNAVKVTKYVDAGEGNRVLSIKYSAGEKQIEIIGTQIAPEFGSMTIVVAAAILGTVGMTILARRRLVR